MTQNPFASPNANPYVESSSGGSHEGGTGTFDIGTCLTEGWEATKNNLGTLIAISIVGAICMMVAAVTIIGVFVVLPIFMWGYAYVYLRAYDGELDFKDLFEGFSSYGTVLLPMLVLMLIFIGLGIPAQALNFAGTAMDAPALSGLSFVVSMVVSFGITIRLYFAPFYIVDQGMSAVEAVKASWSATSELKLMTIGLSIVAGIVGFSGFIIFCIGIIVTMNITYMMYASAYRQMEGRPASV